MALRLYKPVTAGMRFASGVSYSQLAKKRPERGLISILPKRSGRNTTGKITMRHQGGREKRFLREIDWRREKTGVAARVLGLEYDPNRTANVALLQYSDGARRYILAPEGLKEGDTVMSGEAAPLTAGNCLPLTSIPVGTLIHGLEIVPGKGAQMVRGAGTSAQIVGFEEAYALVKLPSSEIRRFKLNCRAIIGQVGNADWKNINLGKAGRKRHMGIRPTVRGTAQNPRSHPHGGGEGRSGEGMHPKTPWGKSARGTRTRSKSKHSIKLIAQRRKG
ncbi:50S ribosomal protein L2 [Candidatus Amesbacteria bacterium RIFCSPHIGHO2_01_FULL_47_34]|nr:MAG: 50S ribosomal protein L2 [Candidatus Amesbacteria bacterium GW2011_GWC1_47_15]KKU96771.1 MAG: 50S ribosomal protein L2 [Candidatus Amesbacteria bacterium GW2011_GWB1_48_13]OGD00144.1 MAG: 50S ribosomal protein L2 [Candidatus Amesbacteria bacterium RIFCSPHIGHO2_01_FULL_47_34]OGD01531.1 MAG: 50S ribosomal protein L2 [Candidatus Amesbacteria bacterium RIFCSPLOWO2_01_FULL_47_33]OGD10156.1 MAG: 50S ribosomal protein L2 [Candidatus Amesbacteria bacterium RIFOXYB1_FULL_47_9]